MNLSSAPSNISVVVASRNRRDELLNTLPRHMVPAILVDNGSQDGTAQAVREQLPAVEVIALPRNLGAPARNVGVERATTPYVAFADDDSWWADGALERAVAILDRHPDIAIVCGRILVHNDDQLDPLCEEMARAPFGCHAHSGHPLVTGFAACGAVVRRDAFLSAGGFDDVVFFPGEEERLVYDLLGAGWTLVYADEVVAHHHPSPSRQGAAARVTAITRSALLTAIMRRPWSVVIRRARAAIAGGPASRAGVHAAGRSALRALTARRRPKRAVERTLTLVSVPRPTAQARHDTAS